MTDNQQAIAELDAARGWETIAAKERDDFQIKDIWGIFAFLTSAQNYYFVGSRGAGKSILVEQSIRLMRNDPNLILSVMDGITLKAIGESAESETVKKFIVAFFGNILGRIKRRTNYDKIAYYSTTYAMYRKWADFRDLYQHMKTLTGRETTSLAGAVASFAKSHLRLLLDVASIKFTLVDLPIIKFGSVELKPIQLEFSPTSETSEDLFSAEEIRANLNSDPGFVEAILTPLINEIAKHCKELGVNTILVLGDDFHFLPIVSQIRIIHFLRRVIGQLKSHEISLVVKIFSATNLSPYIKGVLGLKKELEIRNIESSLENVEIKRTAIEHLLLIILRKAKWSEEKIRTLFKRETIDHLLVLSGGHPRRFLEMSAKLIEITNGNLTNLHHDRMLASAKILSDYRKDLSIQLGTDSDTRANQYRKVYENAIARLAENFADGDSPFFLVPHATIEAHANFSQWVDDAIAIGDLLEVSNLVRVNQVPYKLVCINPATVYYQQKNFRVSYQDIVDFQEKARMMQGLPSIQL